MFYPRDPNDEYPPQRGSPSAHEPTARVLRPIGAGGAGPDHRRRPWLPAALAVVLLLWIVALLVAGMG